jgi:hypothetical protein
MVPEADRSGFAPDSPPRRGVDLITNHYRNRRPQHFGTVGLCAEIRG